MITLPPADETPDAFVLLNLHNEYRILAGFRSSYLGGDSWRLSTPIKKATEASEADSETDDWLVETESGSRYFLSMKCIGYSSTSASMKRRIEEQLPDQSPTFFENPTEIEEILINFTQL